MDLRRILTLAGICILATAAMAATPTVDGTRSGPDGYATADNAAAGIDTNTIFGFGDSAKVEQINAADDATDLFIFVEGSWHSDNRLFVFIDSDANACTGVNGPVPFGTFGESDALEFFNGVYPGGWELVLIIQGQGGAPGSGLGLVTLAYDEFGAFVGGGAGEQFLGSGGLSVSLSPGAAIRGSTAPIDVAYVPGDGAGDGIEIKLPKAYLLNARTQGQYRLAALCGNGPNNFWSDSSIPQLAASGNIGFTPGPDQDRLLGLTAPVFTYQTPAASVTHNIPADFANLTAALASSAVQAGDIVEIDAGTALVETPVFNSPARHQNLTVRKTGAGGDPTIDGQVTVNACVQGVVLQELVLQNSAAFGLDLADNTNVTLQDSTVTGAGTHGIRVNSATAVLTLNGSTVSSSARHGVNANGGLITATNSNFLNNGTSWVAGARWGGVRAGASCTYVLTDCTMSGNSDGVLCDLGPTTWTLTNCQITNNGRDDGAAAGASAGLMFRNNQTGTVVNMDGCTISGNVFPTAGIGLGTTGFGLAEESGIALPGGSDGGIVFNITNLTINSQESSGIHIGNLDTQLNIDGLVSTSPGNVDGFITLRGSSAIIDIDNASITNGSGNGSLLFAGGNSANSICTISNSNVSGGGFAVNLGDIANNHSLTCDNVNFNAGNIIYVGQNNQTGDRDHNVVINNSVFTAAGGNNISIASESRVELNNTTLNGGGRSIQIWETNDALASATLIMTNCQILNPGFSFVGVLAAPDPSFPADNLDMQFINCTFANAPVWGMDIQGQGDWLFDGCTVSGSARGFWWGNNTDTGDSNVTVRNCNFTCPDTPGTPPIYLPNVGPNVTVLIEDTVVTCTGANSPDGFVFGGPNMQVTINNTEIYTPSRGLSCEGVNNGSTLDVDGLTVVSPRADGLQNFGVNATWNINDLTVTGAGARGIDNDPSGVGFVMTLSNSTIDGTGSHGIETWTPSNISVSNTTIRGFGGSGIVGRAGLSVTSGTVIENGGSHGIVMIVNPPELVVADTTISNCPNLQGVSIDQGGGTVTLTNTDISSCLNGVVINQPTVVSITGGTIADSLGINFDGSPVKINGSAPGSVLDIDGTTMRNGWMGVGVFGDGSRLSVANATIENHAPAAGISIRGPNVVATVDEVDFIGNNGNGGFAMSGGAVNSSASITNSRFTNQAATAVGCGDAGFANDNFVQLSNCEFTGNGNCFSMLHENSIVTATLSTFTSNAGVVRSGASATSGTISLVDCTLSSATGRTIALDGSAIALNLIRPTFGPRGGDVFCNATPFNGSISIVGTTSTKVDLTPLIGTNPGANDTVLPFRLTGGDLNLTDVRCDRRVNGFLDTLFADAFSTTVTLTLDRCIFTSGGGDMALYGASIGNDPVDPGFGTIVNARNTIWNGSPTTPLNAFNPDFSTTRTATVTYNLEHCTFTGPNSSTWIEGSNTVVGLAEDVLNTSYTLFDNRQGGVITNPVQDGTAVSLSLLPSGDQNLIWDPVPVGGVGGFTRGEGNLTGTVKANPQVDEDGNLVPGSAAIDAATNSLLAIDYEGDARPQNDFADIGADEVFIPNAVLNWMLY